MSYITLAPGVIFDAIDKEGCLIHLLNGTAYALDPLTTALLEIGLRSSTREEAIQSARERVEADDQQLAEAFQMLREQLHASYMLGSEVQDLLVWQQPDDLAEEAIPLQQPQRVLRSLCELRGTYSTLFADFFLTGQMEPPPLPQIAWWKRAVAIGRMMMLLLLLGYSQAKMALWCKTGKRHTQVREQAWRSFCLILSTRSRQSFSGRAEFGWRLARRELEYCQMVLRCFALTARCLTRSAAFCVYLRTLGFSAQVVIGRSRFHPHEDRFAFHAWTELEGQVVNDHAELQSGYVEITRIPSQKHGETVTRRSSTHAHPIFSVLLVVLLLLLVQVRKYRKAKKFAT